MLDFLYLTELYGRSRLSKYRSKFRDEPYWHASICLGVCVCVCVFSFLFFFFGGGGVLAFLYACVCGGGGFFVCMCLWGELERVVGMEYAHKVLRALLIHK